jgi:hypothetical protein
MKCEWTPESQILEDNQTFQTDCGQTFQFFAGGPLENGFKFCPYCGNVIAVREDED